MLEGVRDVLVAAAAHAEQHRLAVLPPLLLASDPSDGV
jgi:hypothetical protein